MQAKTAAFLLLLAAAAVAGSQGQAEGKNVYCPKELTGTLSVTGQAELTAVPNLGLVWLTISTKAPTATGAREQAAEVAAAVLNAVDSAPHMSADDVSTRGLQLQPAFTTDRENNRLPDGYTFEQNMQVKVENLTDERLAAVIDAVVTAGKNNVTLDFIEMRLSPELQLSNTNDARATAVQNALDTARLLTQAANITLVAIQSMSDSNLVPASGRGGQAEEFATADAPAAATMTATLISIGDTTVYARVSMTFVTCSPAP